MGHIAVDSMPTHCPCMEARSRSELVSRAFVHRRIAMFNNIPQERTLPHKLRPIDQSTFGLLIVFFCSFLHSSISYFSHKTEDHAFFSSQQAGAWCITTSLSKPRHHATSTCPDPVKNRPPSRGRPPSITTPCPTKICREGRREGDRALLQQGVPYGVFPRRRHFLEG